MHVININGHKMLVDENGKLHKLDEKYYDINECYSNNLAFKRPQNKKIKKQGEIFSGLDTKKVSKSKVVEKIMFNSTSLNYFNNNPNIKEKLDMQYGLFGVDHIINDDISDDIMYIYYDDYHYEVIYFGDKLKKRKHFVEKLLGDED